MEDVYKTMYHFKKDACKVRINCDGCPWGVNVKDNSFDDSHYDCKLDGFTEEELSISVNDNKEFLREIMGLSELGQELTWLTKQ